MTEWVNKRPVLSPVRFKTRNVLRGSENQVMSFASWCDLVCRGGKLNTHIFAQCGIFKEFCMVPQFLPKTLNPVLDAHCMTSRRTLYDWYLKLCHVLVTRNDIVWQKFFAKLDFLSVCPWDFSAVQNVGCVSWKKDTHPKRESGQWQFYIQISEFSRGLYDSIWVQSTCS